MGRDVREGADGKKGGRDSPAGRVAHIHRRGERASGATLSPPSCNMAHSLTRVRHVRIRRRGMMRDRHLARLLAHQTIVW